MKFKSLLFIIFICFASINWSQNYSVEYYSQDAELSEDDLVKPEFGRYDGYTFPMSKGELATFIVYSDEFNPLIVLVTPEGKVFYQSNKHQTGLASFTTKIPITGEWVIYVLGNSNDEGKYLFQYGFANDTAQQIPDKNDFCKMVNFLKAHSNAHFIFMEKLMGTAGFVTFKGAYDAYLNGDDASYNIVMYDGSEKDEAEKVYESLISKIKNCSNSFEEINLKNSTSAPEKMKSFVIQFQDDKSKFIEILFYNYSDAEENDNNYSVEFSIMKNNN